MAHYPDHTRPPESGALLLRRGALILLAAILTGLVLFRSAGIWWHYNQAAREGHEQAERLSLILSRHLQQTIATVDATFVHLIEYNKLVGGPSARRDEWDKVIDAALAGLSGIDRISVVDQTGIIRHSTRATLIGVQRRHHPTFTRLFSDRDSGLVAEGTLRDPDSGRLNLPVARALKSKSGAFEEVITAVVDPQLLDQFYREIDFGEKSTIAILTRDGEVLYSHGQSGPHIELAGAVRKMNELPDGNPDRVHLKLMEPIKPGGDLNFTSIRTIPNVPLVVTVSLSSAQILGTWYKELLFSSLVIAAVAILFLLGGGLVSRAMRARAEADEAVKKSEARFYEIIYRAPIFASVKDKQGRVRFINQAMEKLFNTTWKEATGKRLKEMAIPNTGSIETIAALDQEVIERKIPIQRELTYHSRDGVRTALFVKFPLLDEKGEVDSIASFSMDLTGQRRAATWFSTIMDYAPVMITLKETDGRFVFVNRAQAEAAGREVSDFLGRRSCELFPQEYAALHAEFDNEVLAARAPIQREFEAPYAKGVRTLLFVKFPIFDAEGNIESIGSIATDISNQKQAEKQLAHAQRMEAVGQLTGGIAHDFNNLLTVMIGNTELLTEALAGNERLEPLARVTLEAAERSAAITQRLLAFGRRQTLESRSTDVHKLVDEMEPLCKRAAGVRVDVEVRCPETELWPAMVDATQLETAIINLVVNSRDAMPDGGRVVIELSNFTIDGGYVALNPDAKPGDYVTIAVSDTGTGMPPEVVARVFEPFFTTKEAGKGTGLGLPTIYGFIRQSGGHIKIYSEVGHGTVVRLFVPRADAPSIVPSLRDAAGELPRGNERVLLVEDDRIVRDHTEAQLVELGYQVTVASGADEALRLSRLTGRPDLLMTDVMMAGSMNGHELAVRLRDRWPDLRVLCVSGYTDGVLPEVIDGKFDNMYFLAKPFRRRDLALKVREAIEARAELVN